MLAGLQSWSPLACLRNWFQSREPVRKRGCDCGVSMRVQISAEVSCKAAGPWGMVGMIEDTMATQVCTPRHHVVIGSSFIKHNAFP